MPILFGEFVSNSYEYVKVELFVCCVLRWSFPFNEVWIMRRAERV